MSIEDGIKSGELVKVTIVGYLTDGFEGWEQGKSLGRIIDVQYGKDSQKVWVHVDQPGVAVTKVM